MMQTGHSERSYDVYSKLMVADYNLKPAKPTFDGEPRYEDHPHNWKPEELGWFDDADVRQAAYWNLFTGGFGHTYGCHAIWQMLAPGREPIGFARNTWQNDLDLPGAWDMIHVRNLMESRPFTDRIPFQEIVQNENQQVTEFISATRGKDYIMIYIPTGLEAVLNLKLCGWESAKVWWYNCQTGESIYSGEVETNQVKNYKPKTEGRSNDWVLLLDNVKIEFIAPGKN